MSAELPRQANSEYDELLLLLEHGLPWRLRQIWHKSPNHLEPLLVKGGLILPKGFLSKALKSNKRNARGWGHNKYRRKHWYCFDVQHYLQHKKFKYDAPKRQMKLLTEVPTISDNHFHSFQLNYLNKYTNQANNGKSPNPPSNTNLSTPISTPAPANNNPQCVNPSAPDNSTPAPANNNLSQVTPTNSAVPKPTEAVPAPTEAGAALTPTSKNTMHMKTSRVYLTPVPTDANPVSVTSSTPGDAHVDISLLPLLEKVVAGVTKRIDFIGNGDISNDDYLTLAAKMLTMHNINRIEIGNGKVFIICKDCSEYRVCRKQVDNSGVCRTCQKANSVKKFQQKRREENHASRISPQSNVPLTIMRDELTQHGRATNAQRRRKKATIDRRKKRVESLKENQKISERTLPLFIDINPWPWLQPQTMIDRAREMYLYSCGCGGEYISSAGTSSEEEEEGKEHQPLESPADKVHALLAIGSHADAAAVACRARDPDLIHTTMFAYEQGLSNNDEGKSLYFSGIINKFPMEAVNMFTTYYSRFGELHGGDARPSINILLRRQKHLEAGLKMAKKALTLRSTSTLGENEREKEKVEALKEASNIFDLGGKDCAFQKSCTDEYIALIADQEQLRRSYGSMEVAPPSSSLTSTIMSILKYGAVDPRSAHRLQADADRIAKKYKVPEKRQWHVKVRALSESGQWAALRNFADSRAKPPIGIKPFALAAIRGGKGQVEITLYIDRMTDRSDGEDRYDLFCEAGMWKKALEESVRLGDGRKVAHVRSMCNSPYIQCLCDKYI